MEANNFIAKLKADGSTNDLHELEKVYASYKELLGKLPGKDKGPFSLNVLCILCRNIEKVPSWRDKIDGKALLTLSVDCVRETRGLDRPERVKVLACTYHIHKFIVKQPCQLPPELVLKLSYMPFECSQDNLLAEYCKTYWNLLADRLTYMEKLKTSRRAIAKLLPKLTEDLQKLIHTYDSVQFCSTILVFLIKKLHFLYNTEYAKDLNEAFGKIIQSLSIKKDAKSFKKLTEKEILDLYVKFSDCFYVITENASKLNFEDSVLSSAVRTCIAFIGHVPDMFHCLQTFYLNSFCCILTDIENSTFRETVLNSLIISCETTEKLGYMKAMIATYPYINQLLRVYVEYNLAKKNFTEESQETCLKLIILLLDKLKNTEQLLKCDNCKIQSGLHDALRLSFLAKHFVSSSLNSKLDITAILQPYQTVIAKQHSILTELCRLGCSNHEKCLQKLQTDIHNTAILLNKAEHFDFAIKLFHIYLTHEFLHFKTDQDMKNISRALYNKSICELDSKCYEKALLDAFLSLVFAQPEALGSEKHMSLVMDIKAKALKSCDEDALQMMTVLDACCAAVDKKLYGNLKPFFCHLQFIPLLQHEFEMYARLWPAAAPVAGVWRALQGLPRRPRGAGWLCAQPSPLPALHAIILRTPAVVRSLEHPAFAAALSALDDVTGGDVTAQVTQATLLLLRAELNMAEAAVKYEWKVKETATAEADAGARTLAQEHAALAPARRAARLWAAAARSLDHVSVEFLSAPLQVLRVSLQQLLHVNCPDALQLAHVALRVSERVDDSEAYLEAAGILLSRSHKPGARLRCVLARAAALAGRELRGARPEPALLFLCEAAIFYYNTKQFATYAKLIRLVQARLLSRDIDAFPLAVGRLLDAQALVGDLSAVTDAQRHHLAVGNGGAAWCARRRRALQLAARRGGGARGAGARAAALRLWRRARCARAAGGAAGAARDRAWLAHAAKDEAERAAIFSRLRHILGLPTHEAPPRSPGSPAQAPRVPYSAPAFHGHVGCDCHACCHPEAALLACRLLGQEAAAYFAAGEADSAAEHFDGVISGFCAVEGKIKAALRKRTEYYEDYVRDIVEKEYERELLNVELEILIQAAYFELSRRNYSKSDDYIYVRISEILQVADVDRYVKNEVANLMAASEKLRDDRAKQIRDIENDLESLKLSPTKEIMKTPEARPARPPVFEKLVVAKEELPDLKCKIPALDFDAPEEQPAPKKKTSFKIPVPITNRPVLENITPRPRAVSVLVTQPSDEIATPHLDNSKAEFFTPNDSSPDRFFTPQTSLKTYSKQSLRQNIVKNLEREFSTKETKPNVQKENSRVPRIARAVSSVSESKENARPRDNVSKVKGRPGAGEDGGQERRLRRATSPGELRERRLRRPQPRPQKP